MEGYIGEVRLFASNFAPRAWSFCEGQLLAISTHTALFSLIGTIYGGDGRTTFALPDTRSRLVLGAGQGAGLSERKIGAKGGEQTVTITQATMPAHNHLLTSSTLTATITPGAQADAGSTDDPANAVLAIHDGGAMVYNKTPDAVMEVSPLTVTGNVTAHNTGGAQPHNNIQPVNTLHYIICMQGIFPSRN